MLAKEILIQARQFFIDHGWTQKGYFAADKTGNQVRLDSEDATCFCGFGALRRHVPLNYSEEYKKAENALRNTVGDCLSDFYTFNDNPTTTKEMVIAKFDEAIAKCDS